MNILKLYTIAFILLFSSLSQQTLAQNNFGTLTPLKLIQPSYLKAGDTIAIVAPSGVLQNRNSEVEQATTLLKSWGLNVMVGKHVFNKNGHFAGTDAERAQDFQQALDNPKIKAIWCARGGYGTVRILDRLDFTKFRQKPKWLLGYSDITALHNQFHNLGFESIHTIMCTSLTTDLSGIEQSIATFKEAIFGKPLAYTLKGSLHNKTGQVTAPLVGGNLTMLHTMLGSDTSIDLSGKILFIEEIGEYAYHIDRMLQSLKRAGYFDNCKGIIVGDISKVRKNTTEFGRTIEEIILDAVDEYNFPVSFNMPAGHEKDNRAMILGRTVQLNVTKGQSTLRF